VIVRGIRHLPGAVGLKVFSWTFPAGYPVPDKGDLITWVNPTTTVTHHYLVQQRLWQHASLGGGTQDALVCELHLVEGRD
jgi:hypothetical protein